MVMKLISDHFIEMKLLMIFLFCYYVNIPPFINMRLSQKLNFELEETNGFTLKSYFVSNYPFRTKTFNNLDRIVRKIILFQEV